MKDREFFRICDRICFFLHIRGWTASAELFERMIERAAADPGYAKDFIEYVLGSHSTLFLRDRLAKPFSEDFASRKDIGSFDPFLDAWSGIDTAHLRALNDAPRCDLEAIESSARQAEAADLPDEPDEDELQHSGPESVLIDARALDQISAIRTWVMIWKDRLGRRWTRVDDRWYPVDNNHVVRLRKET